MSVPVNDTLTIADPMDLPGEEGEPKHPSPFRKKGSLDRSLLCNECCLCKLISTLFGPPPAPKKPRKRSPAQDNALKQAQESRRAKKKQKGGEADEVPAPPALHL